ncbi:MAG TPA: hypothetical protein VG388_09230 [Solirubrobacteraceae bacterium]|nr:hypothetical protein [Solirubrobacteraceae bacterium]
MGLTEAAFDVTDEPCEAEVEVAGATAERPGTAAGLALPSPAAEIPGIAKIIAKANTTPAPITALNCRRIFTPCSRCHLHAEALYTGALCLPKLEHKRADALDTGAMYLPKMEHYRTWAIRPISCQIPIIVHGDLRDPGGRWVEVMARACGARGARQGRRRRRLGAGRGGAGIVPMPA